MTRRLLRLLVVGTGLVLLVGAVFAGLSTAAVGGDGAPVWLAVPLAIVVVVLSLGKLLRSPAADGVSAAPWTAGGTIVTDPPESTPDSDPISGTELSSVIQQAATDARSAETVEAGLATVRPPLRGALVAALRQGGWSQARIDAALASGSWTDDPVAAAVLDETVRPPDRSLRHRLWAWLFPEKAVRRRTARAIGAVAGTAEAVLPPVVGQNAPRPVPVLEPRLEELQRASDGSLRRAVEGAAAVGAHEYDRSGPEPESTAAGERDTAVAGEDTGVGIATGDDGDGNRDSPTAADWPGEGGAD
ncbi:DUF7269 family protein [Haloarcula onubensis]|uniref:HEAT repeat domain-containing protein n=1 Tax=Haloarcula onubensis TaxID=2950539 RepID=A0ABU2FR16_9EURY|nr:hypothetical protein [Halomicroarcula sp. S3CR25-11]MDS0283210.1 hypothetical protein [Halomicroarcula sp. S3CR25-11]